MTRALIESSPECIEVKPKEKSPQPQLQPMYRYARRPYHKPSLDILHIAMSSKNKALVLLLVGFPELGRLRIQRARTASISTDLPSCIQRRNSLVRLAQQTLQAKQHTLYIVDRTPLVLQNVQADAAREIHVGMVDRGLVKHGRWRVWIIVGECKGKLECQSFVGSLGWPGDGRCP